MATDYKYKYEESFCGALDFTAHCTYLCVGREDLDPVALVTEPLGDCADHVGVLGLGVGGDEEGEAVHHQDQRGHHMEVPWLRLLTLASIVAVPDLLVCQLNSLPVPMKPFSMVI